MAEERVQRRLAAILAADVVGYSRLMGQDEEETAQRLNHYRNVIDELIAGHHGRVFGSAGDSVIAEFASPVQAVRCAVEIQRSLEERNADLPEDRRMRFRIGVNLGDVMVEGDNLLGDGVNVAARVEGLAEPGGICISRTVFDHVGSKLDLGFEYHGEQEVKNIAELVAIYRVVFDGQAPGITRTPARRGLTPVQIFGSAVVVVLIAAGAVAAWWQPWKPDVEPASIERMAYTLPEEPSIAVLPFDNFSGNKQDDFVAKGITEDLITTLSKVPNLFVVSRISSYAFKDKDVTTAEIAEELGIRYIVEGSIQRSGETLRINAQLIDAVKGHHLWAENFDGEANDLFAFQDDIVRRILVELQVKLTAGEHARLASRGTSSLEAWLLWVQGFDAAFKLTREGMVRGRELFEAAHELDGDWARPLVGLSWTYWFGARMGWTDNREDWIHEGVELAEKAVALGPNEPGGYQMLGFLAQLQGDHDRAIALREKALKLAPGDFFVVYGLGSVLYKAGQPKRALDLFKQAQRLSPRMPPTLLGAIAEAHLLANEFEDAIATSKQAIDRSPNLAFPHVILTAAYSALGHTEEARSEAAEVLSLAPGFTVSAWMPTRVYKEPATTEWVAGLLIDAGLPE